MPNWTENELTITGPDVQKVLSAICSTNPLDDDTQVLDFDRIIPYPEQFKALDLRNVEYQGKFFAVDSDDPDRQESLKPLAQNTVLSLALRGWRMAITAAAMTGAATSGVRSGTRAIQPLK